MSASPTVPRLLTRRSLADHMGVPVTTAERIMREIGPTKIGCRYFVTDQQVNAYLDKEKQPGHSPKKRGS